MTAHHRQREIRTGLALTPVMDPDSARGISGFCASRAARRQHRPHHATCVRRVRRDYEGPAQDRQPEVGYRHLLMVAPPFGASGRSWVARFAKPVARLRHGLLVSWEDGGGRILQADRRAGPIRALLPSAPNQPAPGLRGILPRPPPVRARSGLRNPSPEACSVCPTLRQTASTVPRCVQRELLGHAIGQATQHRQEKACELLASGHSRELPGGCS